MQVQYDLRVPLFPARCLRVRWPEQPNREATMNSNARTRTEFSSNPKWQTVVRYCCRGILGWLLFCGVCGVSVADEIPTKAVPPEPTFLGQLQDYFEQAKDAGTTSASSASQWLAEQYDSASTSAADTTDTTVSWLTEMYDGAVKSGDTTARSAKEWVISDIGHIGTWQYKVVKVSIKAGTLEKELNLLGKQRWECINVLMDKTLPRYVVTLKRPHRSYLKQLPAKELLRLLPLLNGGVEE